MLQSTNRNYNLHKQELSQHLLKTKELLSFVALGTTIEIAETLIHTQQHGGRIYTFGNGGSATTALHMANDFTKILDERSLPLSTICLNSNISIFSAVANDCGYENVFREQLKGVLTTNDALIGISVSGNSPNCVLAMQSAQNIGAKTIGLLGSDGGEMKALSNICIHIPSNDYYVVENAHLIVAHALAYALKRLVASS